MAKVTRTVKRDLTVTIAGIDYEPKDAHAESLMRQWIGKRVQVEALSVMDRHRAQGGEVE